MTNSNKNEVVFLVTVRYVCFELNNNTVTTQHLPYIYNYSYYHFRHMNNFSKLETGLRWWWMKPCILTLEL